MQQQHRMNNQMCQYFYPLMVVSVMLMVKVLPLLLLLLVILLLCLTLPPHAPTAPGRDGDML